MCTVSIIRTAGGKVILTSNRDERIRRNTLAPDQVEIGSQLVTFPRDEERGGTWIAVGSSGVVACLLNGGFEKHKSTGNYIKSRGQLVLDVYRSDSIHHFLEQADMEGVEPFTLLVFCAIEAKTIYELVWDGVHKHVRMLGFDTPRLWCSSTLYSEELKARRQENFEQWLGRVQQVDMTLIRELHSADSSYGGFILNGQEETRTVSITQVSIEKERGAMHYHDLQQSKYYVNHQLWSETLQFC